MRPGRRRLPEALRPLPRAVRAVFKLVAATPRETTRHRWTIRGDDAAATARIVGASAATTPRRRRGSSEHPWRRRRGDAADRRSIRGDGAGIVDAQVHMRGTGGKWVGEALLNHLFATQETKFVTEGSSLSSPHGRKQQTACQALGDCLALAVLRHPVERVLSRSFPARGSSKDGSRRRRGCDVGSPWGRVAATPRLRRGKSVEIGARLRYWFEGRWGLFQGEKKNTVEFGDWLRQKRVMHQGHRGGRLWSVTSELYFRRADLPKTNRGDAAAPRRGYSGEMASRRRRGHDADIPWRWPRSDAAEMTWTFGRDRRVPEVRLS